MSEENANMEGTVSTEMAEKTDVGNWVTRPYSFNNRLILEAYISDRSLKTVERNGFAMIGQKVNLKGLRVLVEAHLPANNQGLSTIIPKGSKAYIREEFLHTQPWAKQILESEVVGEKFIIVEMQFVEFVGP